MQRICPIGLLKVGKYPAEVAVSAVAQVLSVPDVEVPIVRTHPVTGRKGLFINEAHTACVMGLPEDESTALLAQLYSRMISAPV